MKHRNYTERSLGWPQSVPRESQTAAEYGQAIHGEEPRMTKIGHSLVLPLCLAILLAVCGLWHRIDREPIDLRINHGDRNEPQ